MQLNAASRTFQEVPDPRAGDRHRVLVGDQKGRPVIEMRRQQFGNGLNGAIPNKNPVNIRRLVYRRRNERG